MTDTTKKIVYTRSDGGVSVVHTVENCDKSVEEVAKKCVPDGTSYTIVDASTVPKDRTFRDAWSFTPD
tara:strand:- start:404 stop:607 length:204 start_codon:yes stop_codon:yes gene_type:complete